MAFVRQLHRFSSCCAQPLSSTVRRLTGDSPMTRTQTLRVNSWSSWCASHGLSPSPLWTKSPTLHPSSRLLSTSTDAPVAQSVDTPTPTETPPLKPNKKEKKQFRMWMPSMPMTLLRAFDATDQDPPIAVFRVLPRMTKHEVKEYLTKIYGLPVKKVNTMNVQGRRKRAQGKRVQVSYKFKNWKKAIVRFDGDKMREVGVKL